MAFGGERIKRLLGKIEAGVRQGRFAQRPVGPLGSLLSLADDKWALAVETAIGFCFNDFLVASMRDLDCLKVSTGASLLACTHNSPCMVSQGCRMVLNNATDSCESLGITLPGS